MVASAGTRYPNVGVERGVRANHPMTRLDIFGGRIGQPRDAMVEVVPGDGEMWPGDAIRVIPAV